MTTTPVSARPDQRSSVSMRLFNDNGSVMVHVTNAMTGRGWDRKLSPKTWLNTRGSVCPAMIV